MKYTKKENVISFILGLIISIPLAVVVFDTHTNYTVPTELTIEPVEMEETGDVTAGVVKVLSETLSNPPVKVNCKNPIGPDLEWFDPKFTEEDIDLLAHLLNGEAGAEWCSDEMIYYVGSVVLNRVASEWFPNTLEEVIFQEGQYACTRDGNFDREPSERCYRIAKELLTYGSVLPENVIYQAEFTQGSGVYKKVQNMYFCYM